MARLVPQPGQCTSSHGVPAITAHRIVGDHSAPRPRDRAAFHSAMTRIASSWAACSAARAHVEGEPFGAGRIAFGHRQRYAGRAVEASAVDAG